MKKSIYILVIGCIVILSGCREAYNNGLLDGRWQVVSIELPDTDCPPTKSLYFSFQQQIIQLYDGRSTHTGTFEYTDKNITFNFNPNKNSAESIAKFGLPAVVSTFQITTLTHKQMILTNPKSIIVFRKF